MSEMQGGGFCDGRAFAAIVSSIRIALKGSVSLIQASIKINDKEQTRNGNGLFWREGNRSCCARSPNLLSACQVCRGPGPWPGDRRGNPENAAQRSIQDRAETPRNRCRWGAYRRTRAAPNNCRPDRRGESSRCAFRQPSCVALRSDPALRRRGWGAEAIPRKG